MDVKHKWVNKRIEKDAKNLGGLDGQVFGRASHARRSYIKIATSNI